jgi:hypothetical protein
MSSNIIIKSFTSRYDRRRVGHDIGNVFLAKVITDYHYISHSIVRTLVNSYAKAPRHITLVGWRSLPRGEETPARGIIEYHAMLMRPAGRRETVIVAEILGAPYRDAALCPWLRALTALG